MSNPLLQIRNRHIAQSGDPPIISNDDDRLYIGYFENPFGEQWIFTYDRGTKRAELRGGDIGWNSPCDVVDGLVTDLILGTEESEWLRACWRAAKPGG